MDIQTFEIPTKIKHGLGAIRDLAGEIKSLGMKRPLIVTDKGILSAGILDPVIEDLKASKVNFVIFSEVLPNPQIDLIDKGALFYKSKKCDGLIGFGGGSPMDTAKAIGVVVANGGSIADYEWDDPQPIKHRIPPTICIPTTAGTGSEVTLWSVVADPKRNIKFNVGGTSLVGPWVCLIDPELTLGLPARVTAATGMDALSHAIECYTCKYAQPLSDAVALLAMEYISQYLRVAFVTGHNKEARYKMCMAAMLAGLAYGTKSAGAAHAMSQSAGGIVNAPHGDLTARLLGPVMEYNWIADPQKFARIAQAMGEDVEGLSVDQAARKSVDAVMKLTEDVEIPYLQDLGFTENQIPHLAEIAFEDAQTIGNPRDLTIDSYKKIYQRTFDLAEN